jgi:hypothetical protein
VGKAVVGDEDVGEDVEKEEWEEVWGQLWGDVLGKGCLVQFEAAGSHRYGPQRLHHFFQRSPDILHTH